MRSAIAFKFKGEPIHQGRQGYKSRRDEPILAETTASDAAAPKPRKTLKPLARLAPYVLRQRKLVAGALLFLVLASITTL